MPKAEKSLVSNMKVMVPSTRIALMEWWGFDWNELERGWEEKCSCGVSVC